LQILYLQNNQLTGSIPDFSGLTNLKYLYLSNNQLTGSIPDFSGLTQLLGLYLSNNQLTGSIPDFSGLTKLQILYLQNNQLTGSIPDFSGLTKLQILYLAENQLTGSIPDFSGLTQLRGLYLNNNTELCKNPNTNYSKWAGTVSSFPACQMNFCDTVTQIPKAQCETLVALYDSTDGDNWTNNTGWLQTNTPCNGWYNVACKNGHVTNISLEDNNLVGTIPDLSALTGLEALVIGKNAGITGAFPDISQLSKLFHLSVGATNITGSLPANIVDASQLRELGVGETKLSGELPDFSQLTNLQVLDLNHSQFSGEIPALPTSLTLLNLAGNNLSGPIPALSGLPNLQTLWLSENQLTGSIPDLTSLTQLQQAYFSHNQLTGSVPSLAGLTELIGFSISRNQLTGPIPELSHLTNLEKIWLDNNDLSGPIPEVSMLTNLQLFTLDGNTKLEGPIPSLPANVETLTLGGELCQNPNADYAGHSEVDAFEICPDVKFIAETSTVEACIGQHLTVTVKKQLAQTVNQIQLALSYDANLLRINTISNAGPLSQFNASHANGSATIQAGDFTGVSDEFELATLQLIPLAASVGTALQFNENQTLVKLNGATLRYEAQGVTVAIKNCVSEVEVKPETNSSIWTLINETEAVEQTGANLDAPKSISFDASGNGYIADSLNHRILKRDTQGQLSVVAGNGKRGFAGDDGPAIEAELNNPQGTAVDEEGSLYIADTNNHRIRKVDSNGIITTVVGNGKRGFAGDEGLALNAKLREPTAIVFDNNGHLYIADSGNHRIRKVSGQRTRKPGTDSIITTFAGDGRRSYQGDNGPATQARLNNPTGLAVDSQNNVYIADTDNHRVRKVDNRGIITTVAGTGENGYSGDGDPAIAAKLNTPTGLEVDTEGNLYIADKNNHRVRKVNNKGIITTFTGTGKRGTSTDGILASVAQVDQPTDVALDQYGNLYVADKGNDTIRKIGEKEGEGPIARPHEIADCANTETTGIPESECYALIALYDSTNGPDWTDNQGWKATDTPCQWTGITCQDGHVSEINLANNNLVGDLPPQIGALVNLTHLNLNDNQVSGTIPTTIEHLNNLATLNLANNKLSGSLPVELSGATNLQTVNLANNQISGEIPDLAPLTQLETLDLQNNLLSGRVPDLTVLPALQTVVISGENQQLCKDSETDYGNLPVSDLDACPTDNQLPTAAFTATPNQGEAPLTVQLDARISHDPYGNITAYFWETSDEQILTGATPTITFNKSGTYEITLRVMDHDGAPSINVAKQLIEVSPAPDQMTLSLDKDGSGLGTVRIQRDKDPAITCKTDCQTESQDYPLGSEIKLTAKAAKGSLFTGWQGDCVGTEEDRRIKLTMDSAKQCTAVFELESPIPSTMHALTIDSVAAEFNSGGSVMVNDLPCETPPCKSYHQRDKNVKITGIPIPHAYFMSWNNDCPVLGTLQDATNLVTLTSDSTCIAYFGNDSVPASEQIAQQFEEVAELSTGESVTEMYPELENRERYELAFLVAEKAMMTAETQMIIPGEESWPDQFDKVEDFFKLPENLWVKKVRIVSTKEDIGQFHIEGQYVRVDVLLLNKNGAEDLVPILIYYKDKPALEETAAPPPPPPAEGNETRHGVRYRRPWRRPIFFRRWW
jgi:Leucine-rich repeat (LRR) protein/sugar lactone lactonase YvrE